MDKSVPELQFPEFTDDWISGTTEEFLQRFLSPVDVNPNSIYREIGVRSHGKGVFHKESVMGSELGNKRVFWVHTDAFIVNIVFGWEQAVAKTTSNEEGYIASHRFPMYIPHENKVDLDFLLLFFLRPRGKHLLGLASPGGAGRNKTLGQKEFNKLTIILPRLPEQQKISKFIFSVENKVLLLLEKRRLLQNYKKGIMHKLFLQELRFKDDQGNYFPDWEEKKFGDIFTRVKDKNKENNDNVLTISAQQGLISQKKYFNKSVSAKDVTGYYLIKKGQFAYNKSYSKGFPMGAIKRLNNYEKGVVSTLYICFNTKSNISGEFYEQYFNAGLLNREIHKIAQEGARNHGLLNISVVEFFSDIKVYLPKLEEQQKIANFLSEIDRKIEFVTQQIEHTQAFKTGLLQKMFV